MIVPLLPSPCSFVQRQRRYFGVSFSGGFQCPSVEGCAIASCDYGGLAGGDERTYFYSDVLNRSLFCYLLKKILSIVDLKYSVSFRCIT